MSKRINKILLSLVFVTMPTSTLASECIKLETNLAKGIRSTNVISLQKYLSQIGLLSASPSGYFGELTFKAVKLFQQARTITQSGYVGPLTRLAISNDSCKTITEVATATSTKSVEVSKPTTVSTSTTSDSAWSTKRAVPLSETALEALKSVLASVGYRTDTFATTSLSEVEIMDLTRKFERDYIFGK
jgi:peptidoglycan hydrolase-like protein with peptidoglycan-binding domain